MDCIKKYVRSGSTIMSDMWSAYNVLDKSIEYTHQKENCKQPDGYGL